MSVKREDLIIGQLYVFIEKGKLYCGEFTGKYTDENKAIMKYNDTYRYVEVD